MNIEWINKEDSLGAVTIHHNYICLSKKAANLFNDAYAVAVGIDKKENSLIIKYVSKDEAEGQKIGKESLHKIEIKSSYGRITGKKMIDRICSVFRLDFNQQQAHKFSAKWNTGYKMLVINLKGGKENAQ